MAASLLPVDEKETTVDPTKPKLSLAKPDAAFDAPSTLGQPVNRLALAEKAFNTFSTSTAPQYQADLRLATQKAAGAGNLGSGQLRTSYGNLANQRALSLDTQRDKLINDAVTGTIEDQRYADTSSLNRYNADTQRLGVTGNLELAKTGQQIQQSQFEKTQSQQAQQFEKNFTLQSAAQALNEKVQTGQLTIAQAQLALAQLAQQQSTALETQKLQLAKDQLKQTGEQFGLSLQQQKDLAELANATQKYGIDANTAQGKNALLLELARIMGAKDSNIDPAFFEAIAAALGIAVPQKKDGSTNTTGTAGTKPKDTGGTTITDEERYG